MLLNMSVTLELLSAIFLFFITHFFFKYFLSKLRPKMPPGPGGWPVVGCLPLLGTMPHVALAQMAKQYGPVMYLKMGSCDMVVASSPGAAKAFLKTLDANFSNRPPGAGATHIAYGAQDFVFADVGPRWNLFRKLSNLHMLGAQSYKNWADIRAQEVGRVIRDMFQLTQKGEKVVVPEILLCAMANLIGLKSLSRRVFATQGSESNEFKYMVVELMRLAGLFNIGDFIPAIAWMDLQGIEGKMKRLHNKFDCLLTKMIEEHSLTAEDRKGNPDFLDVVMANREVSDGSELTMTHIKALLLNWFIAGTDTSAGTVEWALAEMIKNPIILNRAHKEMDQVIGRNRRMEESDLPNLPYLQAICKETLRLHPPVPLSIPRVSIDPCEVNGYYIPKNSRLFVNVWAIGRDNEVWDDPTEFDPDRFLRGKNSTIGKIDPWGNDFELIPFGAGRRICAGIRMGIAAVEYILGTLVHSFEWRLPDGVELDMGEAFGLVLQKAVPLSVVVVPRLPANCFSPDFSSDFQ